MKYLTTISLICLSIGAFGQDIHFSQFYASPIYVNPASAGVFNGDYRITGNYRNQWRSVSKPYAYRTFISSVDGYISRGLTRKDFVGGGITFFNDKAGDANLSTNQVNLVGSYIKTLDRRGSRAMAFGLQLGMAQRSYDFQALSFNEQFIDNGFDPNAITGETPGSNSYSYLDAGLGWMFFHTIDRKRSYYLGASAFHLNRPKQGFLGSTTPLANKYVVKTGMEYKLNREVSFQPKAIYYRQFPYDEFIFGSFVKYHLREISDHSAYFVGLWYRWNDAVMIVNMIEFDNLIIGFSYDANVSSLARASGGNGGMELSIQYIGVFSHRYGSIRSRPMNLCPEF